MLIYVPKIKVKYQPVNEILMTKEYLNLIGREPFLAITWEPDFSQACLFCKMLMNNKNLRFTPILDKTDDLKFLKSPRNLIWGHFWSLLLDGDFFKKILLCHAQLYMGP